MAKPKVEAGDQAPASGPSRPIPKVSIDELKGLEGQEYGGSADVMQLAEGEAAGPFEYQGHQQVTTELGETTVHLAADDEGDQWRLPIQATFLRATDQAKLNPGDKFYVYRQGDQIKKRGKGAGNPMAIYGIKVVQRATAASPAS